MDSVIFQNCTGDLGGVDREYGKYAHSTEQGGHLETLQWQWEKVTVQSLSRVNPLAPGCNS